jgi:hypothetical protein
VPVVLAEGQARDRDAGRDRLPRLVLATAGDPGRARRVGAANRVKGILIWSAVALPFATWTSFTYGPQ